MPRKPGPLNLSPQMLEMKRRYNREYMRRWRADIRNHERERESRERAHVVRKLRAALEEYLSTRDARGARVCGICGRLPAKCSVIRLRACPCMPGGFVKVRLPYCGQC
jgi:hypothetical protein